MRVHAGSLQGANSEGCQPLRIGRPKPYAGARHEDPFIGPDRFDNRHAGMGQTFGGRLVAAPLLGGGVGLVGEGSRSQLDGDLEFRREAQGRLQPLIA